MSELDKSALRGKDLGLYNIVTSYLNDLGFSYEVDQNSPNNKYGLNILVNYQDNNKFNDVKRSMSEAFNLGPKGEGYDDLGVYDYIDHKINSMVNNHCFDGSPSYNFVSPVIVDESFELLDEKTNSIVNLYFESKEKYTRTWDFDHMVDW